LKLLHTSSLCDSQINAILNENFYEETFISKPAGTDLQYPLYCLSGISKNQGSDSQSGSERPYYHIGLAGISLPESGSKHLVGHFVNETSAFGSS
jgi:hypothetical protein